MSEHPVFDPRTSLRNKLRALKQQGTSAGFLMDRVADDLRDRLQVVEKRFSRAIALHCLTDAAALSIASSGKAEAIHRVERHPALLGANGNGAVGDLDVPPLAPHSVDLIVSLLSLHEANDTPGLLAQIRRSLRPDGLFLAAMAGAGTLSELRDALLQAESELSGGASPRVIPFADVRDVGSLLQRAGFALPVTDVDTYTVRYATMFHLMHDLRAMGAGNFLVGRSRRTERRRLFIRAAEIYAERYSDPDGRIRASFSIIWMSGWAPHESQQQPLKPGSGEISLTQVLGD